MMAKFPLVALFLLLSVMSGSSATPCNNDFDCGNEYYCSSEICEECIPCSLIFNRQPPSNNETFCAKTERDCGDCLPGYLADELTNDERNFSTKCYAPEKLDSSNPPATEFKLNLTTIFIASVLVVFVASMAVFAVYKKIRRWKSRRPAEDTEMMGDDNQPQPSAPRAEFDVEETPESNEEMMRLINPNPMSIIQVERPCGASPIGPHHEYHPPVVDATRAAVPSNILETSPSANAPALEMPPRLFRQISGSNAVRPPILRSVSDSGHSHIRLSDHRPTIIRSINPSDQECGMSSTVQNQLQPTENILEVGAAFTIKRR